LSEVTVAREEKNQWRFHQIPPIQLALLSGLTSWRWAPLWAPTSIAPRLSNQIVECGILIE